MNYHFFSFSIKKKKKRKDSHCFLEQEASGGQAASEGSNTHSRQVAPLFLVVLSLKSENKLQTQRDPGRQK